MPSLTRDQSRLIDILAASRYHIPTIVLMENAARAATDVALDMLRDRPPGEVLILCGPGNNGGDGLAAARHLHNAGLSVRIVLTADASKYQGDARINFDIVSAMSLPISVASPGDIQRPGRALMIDAIFGTGLSAAPRPPFDQIVAAVERSAAPVLAIDLPSGLDADTGVPPGLCIRATRTVSFVAEKRGFGTPAARDFTGQVTVADIGCPKELIAEVTRHRPHQNPSA